ncbi:MAG: ankyrin repeat domain-containing protein [bacterium]
MRKILNKKVFTLTVLFFIIMTACDKKNVMKPAEAEVKLMEMGYDITDEAFKEAVRSNNPDIVRLFLYAGKSPDMEVEENGLSLPIIFLALHENNSEVVRELILGGANLGKKVKGVAPLMKAAIEGDIDSIKLMVENGADVDVRSPDRVTPLMMAIQSENQGSAWYLLSRGADVNAVDKRGVSVLMKAVQQDNVEIVRELLKRGADASYSKKGFGAMDIARYNENDIIINMLIDEGVVNN